MSRGEIERLLEDYLTAYERHQADGCAAAYTLEARLDSPYGPPAVGREAIAAAHRAWFEEPERNKRLDLVEVDLQDQAGHCLLRWSAEVDGPGSTAPATISGTTLATLRRIEGMWQFHRMALVPDPD